MNCKKCGADWYTHGRSWQRASANFMDHYCTKCGCKKKPIASENVNVLVIPDLHFPFQKEGYLDFLKEIYAKYNCNTVVSIGDLIDNHYSSFHDTDPDGLSENEEFKRSVVSIKELAKAFPVMKIAIGNHTRIPARKAFSAGLSKRWIKTVDEVLKDAGCEIDGWDFDTHHDICGVRYVHGEGRQAKARMTTDGVSIVQGHWHGKSSIEYIANDFFLHFAMQVGALIDDKAYAFAYGKNFAKSHKNCGVVLGGRTAILEYMEL